MGTGNLDSMLVQAHKEQMDNNANTTTVKVTSLIDPNTAIKQSLIQVLNSKAT